jgi:hypothetical protein
LNISHSNIFWYWQISMLILLSWTYKHHKHVFSCSLLSPNIRYSPCKKTCSRITGRNSRWFRRRVQVCSECNALYHLKRLMLFYLVILHRIIRQRNHPCLRKQTLVLNNKRVLHIFFIVLNIWTSLITTKFLPLEKKRRPNPIMS